MISAKGNLTGIVSSKASLKGSLNNAVKYVEPTTQEKTVTPNQEQQIIIPDEGVFALSKVTVGSIPNEYVKVNGTLEITENGTHDVTNYKEVKADIHEPTPYAPRSICFRDYKGSSLDYELANLDTSNLTTLKNLFYGCNYLTSADVSKFNTSKVTNMEYVFYNCKKITQLDLSSFDISSVNSSFFGMFTNCTGITELDLSNFGQHSGYETSNMFYGCSALTRLDLSNFDTSNVTAMGSMFNGCRALMYLDIRSMIFDKVTNYSTMFSNIPAACEIIVKSDTERDWILAKRSDFTNIKTVAEL